MDPPTMQTLQEPILLLRWVCFRGGGFAKPTQGSQSPAGRLRPLRLLCDVCARGSLRLLGVNGERLDCRDAGATPLQPAGVRSQGAL
jgi:hypothetical protein